MARDRAWTLLLHHGPGLLGRRGEASTPGFYLAPSGRRDAAAELEAALAAFLEEDPEPPAAHAQCRFPARYAWLKERLAFDPARLPERRCETYLAWREATPVSTVTLVFASAYLSNPSSMYGHTFLRLDHAPPGTRGPALLQHAVNFAADADTDNGLAFAFKGLTGLYPGRFSLMPYYLKVQEYNNLESRDLWEYPLNLSPEALERLLAHLYELDQVDFPYFFFNKNCSYQLLPLLELAEPRLRLTEDWPMWVIPADTVRALSAVPGLLGPPLRRPSALAQLRQARAALDADEQASARSLSEGREDAWTTLEARPPDRQAGILDAASRLIEWKADYRPQAEQAKAALQRRVLVKRSALPAAPSGPEPRDEARPDTGHATARWTLGAGAGDSEFVELGWRPALHEPLEPAEGYQEGSALEMVKARLRYETRREKLYLEELTLIRVLSLTPWDAWLRKPSWRIEAGLRSTPGLGRRPEDALAGTVLGGTGYSAALGRDDRLAYVLLEGQAEAGSAFNGGARLGAGPHAGLFWAATPRLRFSAGAAYKAFALGDRRPEAAFQAAGAWAFTESLSLRADWKRVRRHTETTLALAGFF